MAAKPMSNVRQRKKPKDSAATKAKENNTIDYEQFEPGTKNTVIAYLLYIFGGLIGLHLIYVGRYRHALIHTSTFGGFGFGLLRDIFRIPGYVTEANLDASDPMNRYYLEKCNLGKPPAIFSGAVVATLVFTPMFRYLMLNTIPRLEDVMSMILFFRIVLYGQMLGTSGIL
eukprot:m.104151 g.104151  ORF g.104151 m.104151 type:complete len:171 (-) comp13836_c0_seq1:3863-4375(-)